MTVVIFFFVCWCPYHSQRLMFAVLTLTGGWSTGISYVHYYLWLASGLGYYLSCCVNPLVYCVMSKRFRRGFTNVFSCVKGPATTSWNTAGGEEGDCPY